jgi:hypothetical protein
MNESITEVATTTFVVPERPAGGVISVGWEGNQVQLKNRPPGMRLKIPLKTPPPGRLNNATLGR